MSICKLVDSGGKKDLLTEEEIKAISPTVNTGYMLEVDLD